MEKPFVGNVSFDQFVSSLFKSADEMGKLAEEWPDIDPDLRMEYADHLAWLLRQAGLKLRELVKP